MSESLKAHADLVARIRAAALRPPTDDEVRDFQCGRADAATTLRLCWHAALRGPRAPELTNAAPVLDAAVAARRLLRGAVLQCAFRWAALTRSVARPSLLLVASPAEPTPLPADGVPVATGELEVEPGVLARWDLRPEGVRLEIATANPRFAGARVEVVITSQDPEDPGTPRLLFDEVFELSARPVLADDTLWGTRQWLPLAAPPGAMIGVRFPSAPPSPEPPDAAP